MKRFDFKQLISDFLGTNNGGSNENIEDIEAYKIANANIAILEDGIGNIKISKRNKIGQTKFKTNKDNSNIKAPNIKDISKESEENIRE